MNIGKKSCYWLEMLRDQYDIFYLFVYRPEIVNNIKESVLYSIYIYCLHIVNDVKGTV